MILGFSIGSINRFVFGNRNDYITFIREHFEGQINALEILIPEAELNTFKLSEDNRAWLGSLEYVSFHLTKLNSRIGWAECCFVISYIGCIKNIICHIDWKEHIDECFNHIYGDKIIFENTEKYLFEIKSENRICFDISHYFACNDSPKPFFIDEIKVAEIHLSGYNHFNCHIPIHKLSDPDIHIEVAKKLHIRSEIPLIIESNFYDLEEMKTELQFVKESIA